MNKEIANKWCKMLRNGEFAQGRYSLKNANNEYCCLGVLCVLFNQETNDDYLKYKVDTIEDLPIQIQAWAGMKSAYGHLENSNISLVGLNDSGNSFLDIAKVIEDNVDKL